MASKAALQLILQLKGDAKAKGSLKGVKAELLSVGKAASGLASMVKVGVGAFAGFVGAQVVVRGLAAAARAARGAVFGMNATLETATLQFETLMGSADKAREHVQGLFQFAKETPFETEPIIAASRTLQAYGDEALNTIGNMTLIGDAAAGVSAPLDAVGRSTGRLYAALQGGQPFGEAAQSLQELAILSPRARVEMERLQAAGASADEIWAVFTQDLERFTGSMAKQANTWTGMISTIKDSLQLLSAGALKPLFDLAKRGAKTLVEMLDSAGVERAAEGIAKALQWLIDRIGQTLNIWLDAFANMEAGTAQSIGRIAGYLVGLAEMAVTWGFNIVDALSVGIIQATGLVAQALSALGRMIASWLKPGSPPKLLPELDEWGKEAAGVYLEGWAEADFGALREFGATVQGLLRDLAGAGKMDEGAMVPALLAAREGFAALLEEARTAGAVAEETFARIRAGAGAAGEEAEGLARRYAAVAQAQGRLAEVQARLAGLERRQQERSDAMRASELEAILADPRATAGQKERARLEQEMLGLVAEERAAQAELTEAQTELDAYQSRLAVQTETLGILERQTGALGAAVGAAQALSGQAAEIAGEFEAVRGAVDLTVQQVEGFDLSRFDTVFDNIKTGFEEGRAAALEFEATLQGMQLPDWLQWLIGPAEDAERRPHGLPIRFLEEEGQWPPDETVEQLSRFEQMMADIGEIIGTVRTAIEKLSPWVATLAETHFQNLNEQLEWARDLAAPVVQGFENLVMGLLGEDGLIASLLSTNGQLGDLKTNFEALAKSEFIEAVKQAYTLVTNPVVFLRDRIREVIEGLKELHRLLMGGLELPPAPPPPEGTPSYPGDPRQGTMPDPEYPGRSRTHATGTGYYPGGWSLVGERGAELVRLPRGSRIHPAGESALMLAGAGAGGGIHITMYNTIASDLDIEDVAYRVAQRIQRNTR